MTASRNFANKLWNAARFILMNLPTATWSCPCLASSPLEDKWVLTKYERLVREVTDNSGEVRAGLAAAGKLYDFIWDISATGTSSCAKSRLQAGGEAADNARRVLVYVMTGTLQLLHPFMPFITEEIWQALPHEGESIMVATGRSTIAALRFAAEEADFEKVMKAIRAIRKCAARDERAALPEGQAAHRNRACRRSSVPGRPSFSVWPSPPRWRSARASICPGAVQAITAEARILIPMDELVDREKELARLGREKAACEKDIAVLSGKLMNPGFVEKAPANVVEAERQRLQKVRERLAKIEESLSAFS